jgi:hypothetical protein
MRVQQEPRVKRGKLVCLDPKVIVVIWALRVPKAIQEPLEHRDPKAIREIEVPLDRKVLRVCQDPKVISA